MRHPTARIRSSVARWRATLAGALIAGLAMVGAAAGVAAPAAAEEPSPESTLEIVQADCEVYGGPGVLEYIVRDPAWVYADFVTVTDSTGAVVHSATYWEGELTEFEASVVLPQGSYTIDYVAGGETNPRARDTQTFTITCPELDLTVEPVSCSTGADGITLVTFTGLIPGANYFVEVRGPDFDGIDEFVADGETQARHIEGMPPGNSYVYVEWRPQEGETTSFAYDWRAFAVEPCQPTLDISATQCSGVGGDGGIGVDVGDLVKDVEYTVDVLRAGSSTVVEARTVTAGSAVDAQFEIPLPPGAEYTVRVSGSWTAVPYEEPPFIGGGDFLPLETVALAATADVSLAPCPTTPPPPDRPDRPAEPATLAATGPGGTTGLAVLALGLTAVGGAVLLGRRRTQRAG